MVQLSILSIKDSSNKEEETMDKNNRYGGNRDRSTNLGETEKREHSFVNLSGLERDILKR